VCKRKAFYFSSFQFVKGYNELDEENRTKGKNKINCKTFFGLRAKPTKMTFFAFLQRSLFEFEQFLVSYLYREF